MTTEEERLTHTFQYSLGGLIIERGATLSPGTADIDISDLDFGLLERFFRSGWRWGKRERPAVCPDCYCKLAAEETDE